MASVSPDRKTILLTFDVEDWFQVENFKEYIPYSSWDSKELRVEKNTIELLDLLDAASSPVQATFFILGWIAERYPDLVREIQKRGHEVASHGYDRSGFWAEKNPAEAAKIASRYWSQPVDLVKYALTEPEGRTVYDQFIPKDDEMQEIADLMVHYKLIDNNDITGLVDDHFARAVRQEPVLELEDIFKDSGKILNVVETSTRSPR